MLNLNTHLSLDVTKNNKQLQEIESGRYYVTYPDGETRTEHGKPKMGDMIYSSYAPVLTIADIISNAEKLFGFSQVAMLFIDVKKYQLVISDILDKCFQDKPLKEIEAYIVKKII